jgi:hypothetical protein
MEHSMSRNQLTVRRLLDAPSVIDLDDSRRPRIVLLYWDALAYILSVTYPSWSLILGRSWKGWYVLMMSVPTLLLALLGYGICSKQWGWMVTPALAMTALLVRQMHPVVKRSREGAKPLERHRLDANSTARAAIHRGIELGTVYIERDVFDLFVPSSLLRNGEASVTLDDRSRRKGLRCAKAGLLLFPGGLVEHRAYGGVARKLAEQKGIMVVLFNMERLHRLPMEFFGCNLHTVNRAMALLEGKYGVTAHEWSVGGHSLGGNAAQEMVVRAPNFFRNVVLWGVYRELILGAAPVDLLVVQASNDAIGNPYREGAPREAFLKSVRGVQGRSRCYEIQGGNHGGFGDYKAQTYPLPDGQRTISLEAMHNELVDVTASFLLGENLTGEEDYPKH